MTDLPTDTNVAAENPNDNSDTCMSAQESQIFDLTQMNDFSDVVLEVEGRRLYTNRSLLAALSPVWRRLFLADFKEKQGGEIPLPGKTYDDIFELLKCISPGIQQPLTVDNVFQILPLSDEYQMHRLKQDCADILSHQLDTFSSPMQLRCLTIADRYGMENLCDACVCPLSDLPLKELESQSGYDELDANVRLRVLKRRVEKMEKKSQELGDSLHKWKRKYKECGSCVAWKKQCSKVTPMCRKREESDNTCMCDEISDSMSLCACYNSY